MHGGSSSSRSALQDTHAHYVSVQILALQAWSASSKIRSPSQTHPMKHHVDFLGAFILFLLVEEDT